ncbi:hypothetical protein JXC34_00460 [Candidatus Woesearchaeota archaeon]|nr:hypothetical protein [Candidatus Woesearchaeota archaeon]
MIEIDKDRQLKQAFDKIKAEMTDHLEAINENTDEISSNHDYILLLEKMIHKLNERIDELEMKLSDMSGQKKADDLKDIILKPKEQEIFLLLYSRTGDLLDYKEISRITGLTEELVRKYISGIIDKGIPIVKKYFDNKVYLILDADFRNLQAKNNVVRMK